MKQLNVLSILFFLFSNGMAQQTKRMEITSPNSTFIKTKGTQFYVNNKPYNFIGANFWAGMNLGSVTNTDDRKKLLRELDRMKSLGINNLRIMALTEGPDTEPYRIVPSNNDKGNLDERYLIGLDFLLTEMQKRNMYAVVCLSNFWPWSGGFAQYLKWAGDIDSISYPMDTTKVQNWDLYMNETALFYSKPKAIELYKKSIKKIINRINSISKKQYKNDATIMSWELCNEPRGMKNVKDYLAWIHNSAKFIKTLDRNHLVTVGSEGLDEYKDYNGTPFVATHSSEYIDYTCAHLWVQNWNWYDPQNHDSTFSKALIKVSDYLSRHIEMAYKMNKPFVLEEFGIGRDKNSYSINATTKVRDAYYEFVFNEIYKYAKLKKASGVNFWAWAGEGRPRKDGCWWKVGDDFIGDPPHELQGWYSVYDKDSTTNNIISEYTKLMKKITF
ncbi:MAG: glycoside hydrolase 5 family protein [Chitinophagaceae bacterium]